MATRQTVMWTALPNGVRTAKDGSTWLKLAAFMSPRLEGTVQPLTLGAFPDFSGADPTVNWASTANAMGFTVQFKRRSGTVYTLPSASLRRTSTAVPTLWGELFGPTTPVKGYIPPDLSEVKVRSFSIMESASALRDHIAAIASQPEEIYRIPKPESIINPGGLVTSPLTAHLTNQLKSAGLKTSAIAPAPETTLHGQFMAFHGPFVTTRPTPEQIAARNAAEQETDFHKAITALGNYPVLLPILGIVVNFEISLGTAVTSELLTSKQVRIVPTWPTAAPAGVTRVPANPWTAFELEGRSTLSRYVCKGFRAKPRTAELGKGLLVVRDATEEGADDPVNLSNVDVDLALGKMFTALDSIAQQISSQVVAGGLSTMKAAVESQPLSMAAGQVVAGLPTLGQPTVALSVSGADQRLQDLVEFTKAKNDKLKEAGGHEQIVHYAEELVRGYRVDVWDSVTKVWHPLCERMGTYRLGQTTLDWGGVEELIDEGWVQLAPTSSPEGDPVAPKELRLSEQLFTWNGWSLVIQRPGAALREGDGDDTANTMRREYLGPDGETYYPLGEYDNPNLPLSTKFRVRPGTLPRLRFGVTYRFRARAVDLAGNSVPFSAGSPTDTPGGTNEELTTVTRAITHKRYEPVKPPVVVIPETITRLGESPQHLVIASNYDTPPVLLEKTSRHVCPPRTSFTMAEAHGAFDLPTEGRPMDGSAVTHAQIAARDAWDFPKDTSGGPNHDQQLPVAQFDPPLPYLADVPSRGAALTGLPGQKSKFGSIDYAQTKTVMGSVKFRRSDDSDATSEALRIPFEEELGKQADRRPFKLIVTGIEGTDPRLTNHASPSAPVWNETRRELTVQLAKGEQIPVELSSYVNASDMSVFGVYQMGITKSIVDLKPSLLATTISPEAVSSSVMTPRAIALPVKSTSTLAVATNKMIDISVLGRNWTITPHENLMLVHAVRQPMLAPNFTWAPNSLLKYSRRPTQTFVTLRDWVQIHGKSTARLVVNAYWKEPVDDPSDGPPKWGATAVERKGQACDVIIGERDTVAMSLGQEPPDGMSMPVTPVTTNLDPNVQRHSFGDTKHRYIKYSMVASSRFQHYFPPDAETTRSGNVRWVHIPSSAPPLPPEVDLVIPAFKWTRSESAAGASSTRGGGQLRVYLKRPWFSSGDTERLAVLLWYPGNYNSDFSKLQPYVSEWGNDPVYRSRGNLPSSLPKTANFEGYAMSRQKLYAREYGFGDTNSPRVSAVAYNVQFDEVSDRWFADIKVKPGTAYFPFIKLALARFQRWSLDNIELSPTVTVDAVQLAPDRFANLSWSGIDLTVLVSGQSYVEARSGYGPIVTMSVEKRQGDGFAWVPVTIGGQSGTEFEVPKYTPSMFYIGDTRTFWRKTISSRGLEYGPEYRVVIREYERHLTGTSTPTLMGSGATVGSRPVYVDVLPLVLPGSGG